MNYHDPRFDIRDTIRRLSAAPEWLHRLLGWITGLRIGEPRRPDQAWTPGQHLVAHFALLLLAGAIGIASAHHLLSLWPGAITST